jgi:hypothetical protein
MGDYRIAMELIRADDGVLVFRWGRWMVAINLTEGPQSVAVERECGREIAVGTSPGVTLRGSDLTLPPMEGVIATA